MQDSVVLAKVDDFLNWGEKTVSDVAGLACCAIEMMAPGSKHDLERFGCGAMATPRRADLMIVAGQ